MVGCSRICAPPDHVQIDGNGFGKLVAWSPCDYEEEKHESTMGSEKEEDVHGGLTSFRSAIAIELRGHGSFALQSIELTQVLSIDPERQTVELLSLQKALHRSTFLIFRSATAMPSSGLTCRSVRFFFFSWMRGVA